VTRSNEVRILSSAATRAVFGGAMGSGPHADKESNNVVAPIRVSDGERMQAPR
jgi:hypothetical protein